jgi:tetratricopeptide (TPR) repeat protein
MKLGRSSLPAFLIPALAVLAGGCTKEARKEHYVSLANRDVEAGKYDSAEIEYRDALQRVPFDPEAICQLGILYYNDGRMLEALAYLKKGAELDPKNAEVRAKLALAYLALGGAREADAAARKVLEIQPGNEDALMILTAVARTPNDVDDTRQFVEKLRQADRDRPGYHLALGALDNRQRDPDGAENEFKKALALDPKSGRAYMELGNVYLQRHDPKKAEEAFKSGADLAPLRSTARLAYVDFKFRTGAVDQAKKSLDEITRSAPDYIPALVYSMRWAFGEKRYDDCAALIQKILGRDRTNFDALLQRGALLLAQGDSAGSISVLQGMEGVYKHSPPVKYQLALAYLRKGDIVQTKDILNQALLLQSGYEPAVVLLAEINVRTGNSGAAITSLSALLGKQPNVARAYMILAKAYQAEKNPDQALAVYHRMAAVFPMNPEPAYFAGVVLGQQKRQEEARKSFEESIRILPGYAPALEKLLDMDLTEKRYAEATARVQGMIEKYPTSAGPWLFRSKIYLAQNDRDGAESALRKSIDLDPSLSVAYMLLARIYLASNQSQKALDELNGLAAKNKSVPAMMQIALIHEALKQYDAAREAYQKLLSVNPKFTSALNNLAYLYCEHLGQLDLAYETAKKARDLAPDDPNVADTLGWVIFKRGDYHGALALLEGSAEQQPALPSVQYHLGMAHYMLGEEEPARLALQHAVATSADFPEKDEARRRLALLDLDAATSDRTVLGELENRAHAESNDPVLLVRLATIEARVGSAGDSAAHFEAVLKLEPRNPRIMMELAQLYSGPLNEPGKARDLAKSAHEIAPNDAHISQTLGLLLYRTGDFQWSLDLLQQASRELSDQPDLTYELARGYYSVGRVADAEAALQRALQDGVSFNQRDEAVRLASMIAAAKSPIQAQASLPEAARILATDPDYIPAAMVSALAREQQGDYPGARQLDEKILAADPLFAPASRQLALLYAQRFGDDQKAYDLAVRAREAFPDDPDLAKTVGTVLYRRADYAGAAHVLQEGLRKRGDDGETLYYLGMSHYKLKEASQSVAELTRALGLNLSDQEADEARSTLVELKGPSRSPGLSAQPIR